MINFLIQQNIFDKDDENLLLNTLNKNHKSISDIRTIDGIKTLCPTYISDYYNNIFCYGSIEWIQRLKDFGNKRFVIPYSFENYNQTYYIYYTEELMFNRDSRFVPVSHIEEYLKNPIFIRPGVGTKPNGFSGGVYSIKDLDYIRSCFKNDDIIIIAKPKHIDYEFRTIISNTRCVTGCQYKSFCRETKKIGVDPSLYFPSDAKCIAEYFANKINWKPDPIYVMDIVLANGKYSIMELNAINTSGWYDCDYSLIIKEIINEFGRNQEATI